MKIIDCDQNSPEWYAARLGKPTASCFEKIITPTGKEGTQADKYMNVLIAEIIRGERFEAFKGNVFTERGKEYEAAAVKDYELLRGVDAFAVGFCTNDEGTIGCSPDRLIGDDGILEMKVPNPDNHVEHMLKGKLEQEHRPQTQGQLFVTGRQWCDTICWNPKMQPVIIRSERDNAYIFEMSRLLNQFLQRMQARIEELKAKGFM
jgi:hypothetical protein